jgi:hypothetical protein
MAVGRAPRVTLAGDVTSDIVMVQRDDSSLVPARGTGNRPGQARCYHFTGTVLEGFEREQGPI